MKMNKRILKPVLLAMVSAILVLSYSCGDEFFNEKAGDRITPDKHYQTLVDAQVSLQGAISPLKEMLPKLIMIDGLRSDMMDITENADADLRSINEHIFNSGNIYTNPADLYKVIININEVLANIDKISQRDRKFDMIVAPQYKGALIGMRAWTYLTLSRLYGQVAYIEDNMTSLPDNLQQKILSREAILDTLINQVKKYIHDTSAGGVQYEELRIERYVNNKAILGELYLEKNDYPNAVTYLKLACESYLNGPALLKVDRTYQNAAWSTIFLNAESASIENISVIPYSSREGQYNPLSYWIGKNSLYMAKPSAVLIDSFRVQVPAAGPIGDLYRGNGITFMVDTLARLADETYVTSAYITKYEVDRLDPFSSDLIVSRAADIHLMLAEALNRLGDQNSQNFALMLLNDGVNRVNPKPAAYTRWASNLGIRGRVYLKPRIVPAELTGMAKTLFIEDLIMAERAMELAFEGKRWSDLMRVAQRRNSPEYLADKVAAKFTGTPQYNTVRTRLMNPVNWYLPFN